MSDIAIKVTGLGKEYALGTKKAGSFRESFSSTFSKKEPSQEESFWALKDLDFEIKKGEAVGIIGRNGAGKSTLLKILSRITEPTRGRIEINGRMASLLEVGTGFHPELTGRENIFLNGTILGMKRLEVKAKFDEIVAFSGVEKFIDTPVKHYSSGMYVRLAFAVAAHLEPEILVIDEVLAVGDAEFQKKCLGKMEDVAREGRTVIFVSHNMVAVSNLCSKGIYLNDGKLNFLGEIGGAISEYLGGNTKTKVVDLIEKEYAINEFKVSENGTSSSNLDLFAYTSEIELFIAFSKVKGELITPSFQIKNELGQVLFTFSGIDTLNQEEIRKNEKINLKLVIPSKFFNSESFSINLNMVKDLRISLIQYDDLLNFRVAPMTRNLGVSMRKTSGSLKPQFKSHWQFE